MKDLKQVKASVQQRLAACKPICRQLLTKAFRKDEQGARICAILDLLSLDELGFQRKRISSKFMSKYLWVNQEAGIVIKLPFTCNTCSKPKAAVPTLRINVFDLTQDDSRQHIVIQPLVDTTRAKEAAKELAKRYSTDYRDLHYGNAGHYRGKAVFLDW